MSPQQRPKVTLKLATSLDGCIALADGTSKWITGKKARAFAHQLRAEHEGILVGSGTVLADNPRLTCRLPEAHGQNPVRLVADARLRTPADAALVVTARETPSWIFTSEESTPNKRANLEKHGVEIIPCKRNEDGGLNISALLEEIGRKGLKSILVEGGGQLAASFLREAQIDKLIWIRAPILIGNDGVPAIAALGLKSLKDGPNFQRVDFFELGGDLVEILEKSVTNE